MAHLNYLQLFVMSSGKGRKYVLASEALRSADHKEKSPALCIAKAGQHCKRRRHESSLRVRVSTENPNKESKRGTHIERRLSYRYRERERGTFLYRNAACPGQVLERERTVFPEGPNINPEFSPQVMVTGGAVVVSPYSAL